MANAKVEFLDHVSNKAKVKCARINEISLTRNYTEKQYDEFLKHLDFNYNNGYGGQELYGTIWYEDGTWSERGEYDGSEWWNFKSVPKIPKEL